MKLTGIILIVLVASTMAVNQNWFSNLKDQSWLKKSVELLMAPIRMFRPVKAGQAASIPVHHPNLQAKPIQPVEFITAKRGNFPLQLWENYFTALNMVIRADYEHIDDVNIMKGRFNFESLVKYLPRIPDFIKNEIANWWHENTLPAKIWVPIFMALTTTVDRRYGDFLWRTDDGHVKSTLEILRTGPGSIRFFAYITMVQEEVWNKVRAQKPDQMTAQQLIRYEIHLLVQGYRSWDGRWRM